MINSKNYKKWNKLYKIFSSFLLIIFFRHKALASDSLSWIEINSEEKQRITIHQEENVSVCPMVQE